MSNDFSAATGLTAEQIETYARNAVEARYDRSVHGTVARCAFQVGAEWQREQSAGTAAAEPHTDSSALKEDIKRRLAIAFDASSTGIWRDATNLMVKTIDENAAPRPARPDVGEAVAWMFWNEPDTQRHLSVLEPGNHWSTRIPLYAHPPAASSAARVAELEAENERLRAAQMNFRSELARLNEILVSFRNGTALSTAAPEPKSC